MTEIPAEICVTCGDKGIVPATGQGCDGYDRCPDCASGVPEIPAETTCTCQPDDCDAEVADPELPCPAEIRAETLARLRELLAKASPAPWGGPEETWGGSGLGVVRGAPPEGPGVVEQAEEGRYDDLLLIIEARNHLGALLAELHRLRANQTCPHIVEADGGTQHCSMAESEATWLTAERDRAITALVERTKEADQLRAQLRDLAETVRDVAESLTIGRHPAQCAAERHLAARTLSFACDKARLVETGDTDGT